MKKTITATAVAVAALALAGVSSAFAQAPNVQGGSSNMNNVQTGASTFPNIPIIAPNGYAGIRVWRNDNTWSGYIPLVAPVTLTALAATANSAGPFYADIPFTSIRVAQVWWNNLNPVANVHSLRQVTYPAAAGWPHFGGLVVGQVKGTTGGNVYFGEWSPPVASPSTGNSTDLNMTSSGRTVWYAGDNAVTSMPTLVNAQYSVVGIRQTGVGTNLPHAPQLYTGTLTANYSGSSGSITGSIARGSSSVNFAGTSIAAAGTFSNGSTINGRFYNSANALAGIYTGGGAGDHVAFGGKR